MDEVAKIKGLETIAGAIGVSHQTIRGWLRGAAPADRSRKRIEQFLSSEPSSAAAGAPEPQPESGKLFGTGESKAKDLRATWGRAG